MRFANRVPLTFDQGSCAITEALKSIDWKRYGMRDLDNIPLTIFVNMISTQVPYLSTGKQSIAPEPEILHEVRQATMKIARKLQKHLRAKKAAKEEALRSKIFEDYVPVIIRESAKLAETEVPEYKEVLAKVTRRSLAELLGENPDEIEVEVKKDSTNDSEEQIEKVSKAKKDSKAKKVSKPEKVSKDKKTSKAEKVSKSEKVSKAENNSKAKKTSEAKKVSKSENVSKAKKVSKDEKTSEKPKKNKPANSDTQQTLMGM
jgi:DNA topoisomerase-6 subunit B